MNTNSILLSEPFKSDDYWVNKFNHLKPHFYESQSICLVASRSLMGLGTTAAAIGIFYLSPVAITAGLLTALFGAALSLKKEFPEDPLYCIQKAKNTLVQFADFPDKLDKAAWEALKSHFSMKEIKEILRIKMSALPLADFIDSYAMHVQTDVLADGSFKEKFLNHLKTCSATTASSLKSHHKTFGVSDSEFGDALAGMIPQIGYQNYVSMFPLDYLDASPSLAAAVKDAYLNNLQTNIETVSPEKVLADTNSLRLTLDELCPSLKKYPIATVLKALSAFDVDLLKAYFLAHPEWQIKTIEEIKATCPSLVQFINKFKINGDSNYLLNVGLVQSKNPYLLKAAYTLCETRLFLSVNTGIPFKSTEFDESEFYIPFARLMDCFSAELNHLASYQADVAEAEKSYKNYEMNAKAHFSQFCTDPKYLEISKQHADLKKKYKAEKSESNLVIIENIVLDLNQKNRKALRDHLAILLNQKTINYFGASSFFINSMRNYYQLLIDKPNHPHFPFVEALTVIHQHALNKINKNLSKIKKEIYQISSQKENILNELFSAYITKDQTATELNITWLESMDALGKFKLDITQCYQEQLLQVLNDQMEDISLIDK